MSTLVGKSAGLSRLDEGLWSWIAAKRLWVALAIMLVNIGLKAPFLGGSSLYLDEAVAIYETQGSVGETIQFSAEDPTPPLFYLILGVWCKVFGISEASARFPSMVFSAVTAGLIFLLGLRHFNVRAGLFAALFFTCSGVGMVFAHEARAYALASMLMVISYLLFLDLFMDERPRWGKWLGLILVNAMVLYTHYLTSMGIAAQAVMSLWLLKGQARRFLGYVGSQVAVLCLWLPWVVYNRSHLSDSKVTAWLKPPDLGVLDYVLINFAGSKFLKWFAFGVILAGLVTLLYLIVTQRQKEKVGYPLIVVAGWLAISMSLQYFVAIQFMPVFELKYVLYALPGGFLLIGALISLAPLPRIFQYAMVGVALWHAIGLFKFNPQKPENWRDAVGLVKEMQNAQSEMMVMAYYHYPSFLYYYDQEIFKDQEHVFERCLAKGISFGQDTKVFPPIDSVRYTNVILVQSHIGAEDKEHGVYKFFHDRYCIARRGAFPGVQVYQFQNPPCKPWPGGHFVNDFESLKKPEEANRLVAMPDSTNAKNHGTFVGPGHEYSVTNNWLTGDVYNGQISSAEIKVRGKLSSGQKQVVLVFTIEHNGEAYNWTGFELQHRHADGNWFEDIYQVIIPEVKGLEDKISLYFWSPDGGEGVFDNLEIDFWQG